MRRGAHNKIVGLFYAVWMVVLALLALLAVLCEPIPALAYVDPSVMTYTIQALAGVAVALGAVAGVAFRRTRKWLFSKLGIDENARKQKEGAVHRVGTNAAAVAGAGAGASAEACAAARQENAENVRGAVAENAAAVTYSPRRNIAADLRVSWPLRLGLGLLAGCLLSFTLLFCAPVEIYAGSAGDLVFPLLNVVPVLAVAAGIVAVVLGLLLSLLRGRVFAVGLALCTALSLCLYVQALFLNAGLPLADGTQVVWRDHLPITFASAAVWVAIMAGGVLLALRVPRANRLVCGALACALIFVQAVGVASLLADSSTDAQEGESRDLQVTDDALLQVSSENNVIVFVIDTVDTRWVDDALQEWPDMLDGFDGFTYYHNSAGAFIPTAYSIPYLLTNEFPLEDDVWLEYCGARWERSSFLDDVAATGASVGIYSTDLRLDLISTNEVRNHVADLTCNIHELDADELLDVPATLGILYRCALYRDVTWLLKRFFWFYTADINDAMVAEVDDSAVSTVYQLDDAGFLQRIQNEGLQVREDVAAEGAGTGESAEENMVTALFGEETEPAYTGNFQLIHLTGAHAPYTMDENGVYVGDGNTNRQSQLRGTFRVLDGYFDALREAGLYESSTIIVMADHGDWYYHDGPLDEVSSPVLLVKPAGAAGTELAVSEVPVGHQNFCATVADALGMDASAYGTPVWDVTEQSAAETERIYYMTAVYEDDGEYYILQYAIGHDALNIDDWHLTGVTWDRG